MANDLIRNRKDAMAVHAAVCGDFRTVRWHSAGNVGGIWEFMAGACTLGLFYLPTTCRAAWLPAVLSGS